ncbi:hypothetical protein [Acrocarpospora catenulata]|uniref:hypothetical protein n=1 Tax=Acrocarpospora catenulata TaxID=2836182 RepID=UPI001BD99C97|nr:hypothetical protein [Acrocarpospora catenulata]
MADEIYLAPAAPKVGESDPVPPPAPAPSAHRERIAWTVGVTLLVLLMGGLFLRSVQSASGPGQGALPQGLPQERPVSVYPISDDMRRELAVRVIDILEQSSTADHHKHGHDFGDKPARIICAVDPFGVEPYTATKVTEVRRVFAQHMCAITDTGDPWAKSVRAAGPLAVDLANPPKVEIPQSGEGYPEHVRQIIPDPFLEAAFSNYFDPNFIESARLRFENMSVAALGN